MKGPVMMKTREEIETMLAEHVAARVGCAASAVDRTQRFDNLGLDSADAVGLIGEVEDFVGRELSATLPYKFPTIEKLAAHLADG
jgi:acyl carrier protein